MKKKNLLQKILNKLFPKSIKRMNELHFLKNEYTRLKKVHTLFFKSTDNKMIRRRNDIAIAYNDKKYWMQKKIELI